MSPILTENGGWAIFNGTPRGENYAKSMLDARASPYWFAEVLTVDDTGLLTEEDLARALKELTDVYGPDTGLAMFRQEYHCSFTAPIPGSALREQIDRIEQAGTSSITTTLAALRSGSGGIHGLGPGAHGRHVNLVRPASPGRGADHRSPRGQRSGHRSLRGGAGGQAVPVWPALGAARRALQDHSSRPVDRGAGQGSGRRDDGGREHERAGRHPGHSFDAAPGVVRHEPVLRGRAVAPPLQARWDEKRRVFHRDLLHDWSSHDADAFRMLAVAHQEPSRPQKPTPLNPVT